MLIARGLAFVVCGAILTSLPAAASHLVTGNGFGFAVVSPESSTVTKFYAHPYSFVRPEANKPLSEGVETTNFIKLLAWGGEAAQGASAEYVEDSHVVQVHSNQGEGLVFMPFGLRRATLVISWDPRSPDARQGGWHTEWSHPISSQRAVRLFGREVQLLKFDGVQESLLLIPLGQKRIVPAQSQQVLEGRLGWALISLESDNDLEPAVREFNHLHHRLLRSGRSRNSNSGA
jgi:hypothetical protein